jgi:hypothetical protein
VNKDDLADGIEDHLASMEIESLTATVAYTIDATLREVLGYLRSQDHLLSTGDVCDFLEAEVEL